MSKQKVFAIALVVLLGTLAVGGTSAYFASSSVAHNIITTGGVTIELIEDTDEIGEDGRPVPFVNIEDAMPGDRISKMPKIKNVDSGEIYVRMRVMPRVEYPNGRVDKMTFSAFSPDISRSWSPKDGYYYFTRPLASGETTNALFTTLTIPKYLDEDQEGAKYIIKIKGEAVQRANNGETVFDAQGWPGE